MSRLEFTARTMREAWARSGGICECHLVPMLNRPHGCGQALGEGNTFYEHITPDGIKANNALENCAALSKTCWREKTNSYDKPVIAKSNRVRDRAHGIKTKLGRKLQSRGFERRPA